MDTGIFQAIFARARSCRYETRRWWERPWQNPPCRLKCETATSRFAGTEKDNIDPRKIPHLQAKEVESVLSVSQISSQVCRKDAVRASTQNEKASKKGHGTLDKGFRQSCALLLQNGDKKFSYFQRIIFSVFSSSRAFRRFGKFPCLSGGIPRVCENCTKPFVTDLLTNHTVSNLLFPALFRQIRGFSTKKFLSLQKSYWQFDIPRCQKLFSSLLRHFYHFSHLTMTKKRLCIACDFSPHDESLYIFFVYFMTSSFSLFAAFRCPLACGDRFGICCIYI